MQATDPMRRRRRHVQLATLALVLGLVLTTFFGVRAWRQYEYAQRVNRGELQVEGLRGWMTLPYIAKAYGVPESELRAALDLPPQGFQARSLRDWFEATQMDPVEGRQRIEALILKRGRALDAGAGVPADAAQEPVR